MRKLVSGACLVLLVSCGGGGSGDDVDAGQNPGDPDAAVYECVDDVDCGDGEICKGNECLPAGCEDDLITGNESDIDCGGDCLPCANNFLCNQASDCESLFCAPSFRCSACQSQVDCAAVAGTFCDGSACVDTQDNGTMCSNGYECTSGICDLADSNLCEAANVCGNGVIEDGENCDDGNTVAGDTCESDCSLGTGQSCTTDGECGTGVCDTVGSAQCEAANVCGNGKVEGAEVCDDGNTSNGDGCQSNCKLPNGSACTLDSECYSGHCDQKDSNTCESANTCGNGTVETALGETCDDGNTTNGDGCQSNCKLSDGEPCTLDNQCGSGVCDTVSSGECEPANTCGNSKVESGEYCDDGNTANNDGCSSLCKLYNGDQCLGNSTCVSGNCERACNTKDATSTCLSGYDDVCCDQNCEALGDGGGVCAGGTCMYGSTKYNDNDCLPFVSNTIVYNGTQTLYQCIYGMTNSASAVGIAAVDVGNNKSCQEIYDEQVAGGNPNPWVPMQDNDDWTYTSGRWVGSITWLPDPSTGQWADPPYNGTVPFTSCFKYSGEANKQAYRIHVVITD